MPVQMGTQFFVKRLDPHLRGDERKGRDFIHTRPLDFNPTIEYSPTRPVQIEGRHLEASDDGAGCGARGRGDERSSRHSGGVRGSARRPLRAPARSWLTEAPFGPS